MKRLLAGLATLAVVITSLAAGPQFVAADDGWTRVSPPELQDLRNARQSEIAGSRLSNGECGFRLAAEHPAGVRVYWVGMVAENRATCKAIVIEGELTGFSASPPGPENVLGSIGAGAAKAKSGSLQAPSAHGNVSHYSITQQWVNGDFSVRDFVKNDMTWHWTGSEVYWPDGFNQGSSGQASYMTREPGYAWFDAWSVGTKVTTESSDAWKKNTSPNFGCMDVNGYLYGYGWYNGTFTYEGYGSSGCGGYRTLISLQH